MQPKTDNLDAVAGQKTLILGGHDFHSITEVVSGVLERPAPLGWWAVFGVALLALGGLGIGVPWLVWEGIGVWGLNVPVGWAWDITNFVFWVGIGHAGTLISAILFLFRQKWRTSINRAAEAMTIFAVMCALHLPRHPRRPRLGGLLAVPAAQPDGRVAELPQPAAVGRVRGQHLRHGVAAVLVRGPGPRPRHACATGRRRRSSSWIYGVFALGWRGSQRHWQHYEVAYLILAGLSTPLVLSVHSIVSFDFAVSQLPGWHTTIFPPYFVAGAIFSGFAMVMTLMVICRKAFGLEADHHHAPHREHDQDHPRDRLDRRLRLRDRVLHRLVQRQPVRAVRLHQPRHRPVRLGLLDDGELQRDRRRSCSGSRRCAQSLLALFVISIFVNIGMWFERFVIIVTSLHRDFLPS